MKTFVPYSKRSKKEQKRADTIRRGTWGPLSPITRTTPNPKAYNRKRAQKPTIPPDF